MEKPENNQPVPPTPSSLFGKLRVYKKQLLVATVVLVLIFVVFLVVQSRTRRKAPATTASTIDKPAQRQFKAPTDDYGKMILEADLLYTKPDYDGAIRRLTSFDTSKSDADQKYGIYTRLAQAYRAKNDWPNALKSYEQAQQAGPKYSQALYPEIAEVAEKAGDKAKAIAAYKKSIEILSTNTSPVAKRLADSYQAKIKSLGGS